MLVFNFELCLCRPPPRWLRALTPQGSLRNIVFALFILRHFRKALRQLRGRGIVGTAASFFRYLHHAAYGVFLNLPGIKSKVQGQIDDALQKLEDKLVPKGPGVTRYTELPKEGLSDDKIREILTGCACVSNWVAFAICHLAF